MQRTENIEEFDLVILGGGTGSTLAAWTFASEGRRVALVDRAARRFAQPRRYAVADVHHRLADRRANALREPARAHRRIADVRARIEL